MPDLGKYGVEILSAYAATVVLLSALILLTWVRSRSVRRALDAAEKRLKNG